MLSGKRRNVEKEVAGSLPSTGAVSPGTPDMCKNSISTLLQRVPLQSYAWVILRMFHVERGMLAASRT